MLWYIPAKFRIVNRIKFCYTPVSVVVVTILALTVWILIFPVIRLLRLKENPNNPKIIRITVHAILIHVFSWRNGILQILSMRFHDESVWNFFTATLFTTKRHPENPVYAGSWRKRMRFSAVALFTTKRYPANSVYMGLRRKHMKYFCGISFRDEMASNKSGLYGFATKKTDFFCSNSFHDEKS